MRSLFLLKGVLTAVRGLVPDFNECADLRNAGVLRWKWMAGRLKFRAEIAFPGLTGRGGVRSPAAFVFIVPRAYPNKPPTVFMWDETSHSPGPQLTKDQLPIVAPSSWVPVLSIRDVVLAIADKFYDVRHAVLGPLLTPLTGSRCVRCCVSTGGQGPGGDASELSPRPLCCGGTGARTTQAWQPWRWVARCWSQ